MTNTRLVRLLSLLATIVISPLPLLAQARPASPREGFTVVEASIDDMRKALEQRRTTSREIVLQYLTRIATYEDQLNAIITVNPTATRASVSARSSTGVM